MENAGKSGYKRGPSLAWLVDAGRGNLHIEPTRMRPLYIIVLALAMAIAGLQAEPSAAEQKVVEGIKSPHLSVVHLWAPWCSNCQAELKSGGWVKTVQDNPQV